MEAKNSKIIAVSAVIVLLIALLIFWLVLGSGKAFFILSGIDLLGVLAVFTWILFFQLPALDRRQSSMARRLSLQRKEIRHDYSFLRKVAGVPTKFAYETLAKATDDFHSLIGRGSSASVFKGILDAGTPVAVKRIESTDHADRELRNEVSAIASVQHVNLVRLLGYCINNGSRHRYFLVYDYIYNGSLDKWIFPNRSLHNSSRCLPWPVRYRVAIDVARALAYLHHDCRSRILHLDLKPENILLDETFRALVSDFGLSRLMNKEESKVITTVRGTRGYLAPEWLAGTGISFKSDVFSYGMVLLEIISGRRNLRQGNGRQLSYFPKIVMDQVKQGRSVMEVVDKRLIGNGGVEERQVETIVGVALWCVQHEAKLRPSMAIVVDMLEGRVAVEQPPPTEMTIMDLLYEDLYTIQAHSCRRIQGMRVISSPPARARSLTSSSFEISVIVSGR